MFHKHDTHWLEREDIGDVTVVRLKIPHGVNDITIREVFDPIYGLLGAGRNRLVLSLAGAESLPSMAIGKLVMLNRKAQAAHGRLALCSLSSMVQPILEATHLNDLFHIYGTEREAISHVAEW
jgi:anti-sigma B factor antagonist